jgi:hypothetical protein
MLLTKVIVDLVLFVLNGFFAMAELAIPSSMISLRSIKRYGVGAHRLMPSMRAARNEPSNILRQRQPLRALRARKTFDAK